MGKHTWFSSNFFQVGTEWQDFTVVRKLITHFKNLYGFGGRRLKIYTDICMDFNHVSRSITSFLFTPKASNLVKWQLWTWSLMWWCQFIDWLKIKIRPSSLPAQFRNGQFRERKSVFTSICHIWLVRPLEAHGLFFAGRLSALMREGWTGMSHVSNSLQGSIHQASEWMEMCLYGSYFFIM